MRLWTLHPKYLDASGLTALWRESLLARAVLRGETRGYRHHPQLARFQAHASPAVCIERYLEAVFAESVERGYAFDGTKLQSVVRRVRLRETRGQLLCEWAHLKRKLRARSPARFRKLAAIAVPDPHPMFRIVSGGVRDWEKADGIQASGHLAV